MRLYIIGNGFDIRHGLPTGYKHFKSYVKERDKELYEAIEEFLPAGDEWNDLEKALGEIDYDNILDKCEVFLVPYSAEDWSDAFHHDYQYEVDKITHLLSERLKEHFTNWVKGIDITIAHTPNQYIPPIPMESIYFSFNYTNTLQQVYSIPESNIIHIHGNCCCDKDIKLGHGFKIEKSLNPYAGPDQDSRIAEAYDNINEYFGTTFKPVEDIIKDRNDFFSSLKNVHEVFIFGHSLAEIDGEYFSKINKNIQGNSQWVIALYEGETKSGCLEDYGINSSNILFVQYENKILKI
ncbi:bacteriophage abortive infection AbiH family protein [Klebsiella sp. K4-172]|uniref:bacteriophage abortive infection AbiH family protein n=1 Tax=Klebsiella sp. K4-172 TaxID=2920185 RepID=UPI0024DE9CC7|nr:bacteriophage abortive infection AbiH family protein [Klebsiella sp. K4-172]MDK1895491.1 bacteriophage abortive infection AbiH family protein [Klebsiella sp. K4-172]